MVRSQAVSDGGSRSGQSERLRSKLAQLDGGWSDVSDVASDTAAVQRNPPRREQLDDVGSGRSTQSGVSGGDAWPSAVDGEGRSSDVDGAAWTRTDGGALSTDVWRWSFDDGLLAVVGGVGGMR